MKLRTVLLVAGLGVALVARAELKRDVVYGRVGDTRLLLDVDVPEGDGPFPIAILVHGGGWSSGDKSGSNRPGDGADITPWFEPLTAAHFTWFSINYRLAPQNRWPACFEDVETAIKWVKAHAAEYKGDPNRIALFGHSAGGHLVCLVGTRSNPATRVQAVVGFAPVTDFEQDLAQRGGLSTSLQQLFDQPKQVTPESLQILRGMSPVNRIKPGLPPFLLVHGDADKTVPIQQSINFQTTLRRNGVPCELMVIKGAPHSLVATQKIDPGFMKPVITWLEKTLGPGK